MTAADERLDSKKPGFLRDGRRENALLPGCFGGMNPQLKRW
jgi:hypothetical protein